MAHPMAAAAAAENYEINQDVAPWQVLWMDMQDIWRTFGQGIACDHRGRLDDRLDDLKIRAECLRQVKR